jgi:hypothetical protein
MESDLGRLTVERLIVHEIPQRLAGGAKAPKLVLSEIDSQLTPELKNYFAERIRTSLATAAYDVSFDPGTSSPVPEVIGTYLYEEKPSLVEMSKKIATHLHESQTAVNNPGLLVVAEVIVDGRRSLGILKLEKEEGVRVRATKHQEKRTFDIEHLRDLMLTERTRVFKVGLFIKRGRGPDSAEAVVSDKQRGFLPKTEIADFFLRKFLGCTLREAPDVETKRFFTSTETYINEKVEDPAIKARYQIALMAELNASRSQIRPKQFAEQHLDLDDRQSYIDFLSESGVSSTLIDKDVGLIAAQLRRVQVDLESGIAVLGTAESFESHVKMRKVQGGRTRIEIEDRVKRVRSRR